MTKLIKITIKYISIDKNFPLFMQTYTVKNETPAEYIAGRKQINRIREKIRGRA